MAKGTKEYKVIFHFDNPDEFLDGFCLSVEAESEIDAIERTTAYENFITIWKGKLVCVRLGKYSYIECELVGDGDAK